MEDEANALGKKKSIWDDFYVVKLVNVGYKLEYVMPTEKGDIVEIEMEDIRSEITYWGNAVVCYVLGAHPPFTVIQGYIQRLWGKFGIVKVDMLKNGVLVVRFETVIGKHEALQGGIYHFDNKPFIVKEWTPELEFTKEELQTVPIWVKFPGLDFKYWSRVGLSKIERNGLNFVRILVEVEMGAQLPEMPVQYDWKPTLCKFCKKYGHEEEGCRIKKKGRKTVQIPPKQGNGQREGNNHKWQAKGGTQVLQQLQTRQAGGRWK
ncbi:hypothetical protein R3W88_033439 [Solanum pinnatisectum]|uniref:DUF4283 domain-containing protein n=1 Tax=Solanum pinnatisectum TaxID=50273 RepID=A0AAV9K337_9SOLN|nr:hypothetical protein R3W88_033439 [Solanum pinnatisectum]